MQIDVQQIDIVGGERTDGEADRDQLYFSIKDLGLLQPIVVVESEQAPGRFHVISGRRRLNAVRRLDWPVIDATVRTFDEVQAEMAEISENLHRLELTTSERDRHLLRFRALYVARHPELANQIARKRSRGLVGSKDDGATPEGPSAVESTAKQFGVSKKTVAAAIKRAESLTDLQRQALEAVKLPLPKVDRIAQIEVGLHRDQVVNLVAAGMNYVAAMQEVLGDAFEGDADEDRELEDEEFLEQCRIRHRVNKDRFDADALLYRKVQKAKVALAREIGWAAMKAAVTPRGPYFRRLLLFLEAKHPKDWITCSNCVHGQTKGGECDRCRGGGYQIG